MDTRDDTKEAQRRRSSTPVDHLVIALECDRPHAGSARYCLEGIERITFGRAADRGARRSQHVASVLDVHIPDRSLSAEHARLLRVGFGWAVEDLTSTNGTYVDGERVARSVLHSDALLQVGHTFLRLHTKPVSDGMPRDVDTYGTDDPFATVDGRFSDDVERLTTLFAGGLTALLLGESGTGKEVLARRLHRATARRGPFVPLHCGAIPTGLVESHLFGHVRGAFSSAVRDEPGYVRAAHGGTLFLDEVADLSKTAQAALLRVLQEREVVPVGATAPLAVDLQVVAATHRPLERLAERGKFRHDLYARIAGSVLEIPPLRDRRDDLGTVVAALIAKLVPARYRSLRFEPQVGRALLSYGWPLNIRELEQCLATSILLAKDGTVDLTHLPPRVAAALHRPSLDATAVAGGPKSDREDRVRLELLEHLSRHHGNVTEVARAMGKPRTQIHRWCKRFNLSPDVFRR